MEEEVQVVDRSDHVRTWLWDGEVCGTVNANVGRKGPWRGVSVVGHRALGTGRVCLGGTDREVVQEDAVHNVIQYRVSVRTPCVVFGGSRVVRGGGL